MTKEELIQHCERQVEECEKWAKYKGIAPSGKIYEEHKLILDLIKALEQQPSEDCVSRQEMLKYQEYLRGKMPNEENYKLWKFIKELPPVTPTRKVGKWIEVWESQRDEFSGEYDEWREHKCSICDFQEMDAARFNFCPNCGAEMRGAENVFYI